LKKVKFLLDTSLKHNIRNLIIYKR